MTSALSNQSQGFEGVFPSATLHDLIQMQCLGMHTRMVRVERDGIAGRLYFAGGQVVHAELGTLIGEEAFFQIVGWPTGAFHVEEGVRAPDETITCGWEHLLMDAAHRHDEFNHSQASITPFRTLKPIAMPPSPILEVFNDPDVINAVQYGADSTVWESKSEDPETLQATFCYIMQLLEHVGSALGADGLSEAQLIGTRTRAVCVINPEVSAVVVAGAKTNLNLMAKKLSQV